MALSSWFHTREPRFTSSTPMTSEDAYTQKYTYTQTYSTYTLSFSVSRIDLGYGSIC